MADVKGEIFRLLREDEEFRYAVAGLIGLEDIRRSQARLEEAMARLEERQLKVEEALILLDERQLKTEQALTRLEERQTRTEEGLGRLDKRTRKLERGMKALMKFIEATAGTIEDEARSMFEYRLKRMGVEIKLTSLVVDEIELDVYGMGDGLVFAGEVKTRLRNRHISMLEKKLERLKELRPELFPGRVVKVIYAIWVHPEVMEKAAEIDAWILTPSREITPPPPQLSV